MTGNVSKISNRIRKDPEPLLKIEISNGQRLV